jgi:hypothetical protein
MITGIGSPTSQSRIPRMIFTPVFTACFRNAAGHILFQPGGLDGTNGPEWRWKNNEGTFWYAPQQGVQINANLRRSCQEMWQWTQ